MLFALTNFVGVFFIYNISPDQFTFVPTYRNKMFQNLNKKVFKFSLTNFLYIYKPKRLDMFFIVFVAVGVYLLKDLLIKQ
jgi:hypothetical protein